MAATACGKERVAVNFPPPPADKLVCAAAGARPHIPGEYVIDWSKVTTVPQARTEHEKYVAAIRSREGVISGYILDIEGKLFACSNNAAWVRNYYHG